MTTEMNLKVLIYVICFSSINTIDYDKYCKLNCDNEINTVCEQRTHFCQTTPLCEGRPELPLTRIEQEVITDAHNRLRNKLASGLMKDEGFEQASNMRYVSYNRELAFTAQCWANVCQMINDKCRITPNFRLVGQNLYQSKDLVDATKLRSAVDHWAKFLSGVKGMISDYKGASGDAAAAVQLIWAQTFLIGCGKSQNSRAVFLVCNYYPSIEVGHSIYEKGKPCSECSNVPCNPIRKSLCGLRQIVPYEDMAFSGSENTMRSYTSIFILIISYFF